MRRRLAVVAVIGVVAALSSCARNDVQETPSEGGLTTVTMAGGSPSLSFAATQLMSSKDFGRNHGLDIDYQTSGTASSSTAIAGVLAGSYDSAAVSTSSAIDSIRAGSDIKIVAGITRSAHIVVVRKDAIERSGVSPDAPPAERIRALKGMKIATSAEGQGAFNKFRGILESVGMDSRKDVTILPVNEASALLPGLKQGLYNGIAFGAGVAEAAIADGTAQLWISVPGGDTKGMGKDEVAGVVVTTGRYATANPQVVSAINASVSDALAFINANKTESAQLLKSDWFPELDQTLFDLAWRSVDGAYPTKATFTEENLAATIELLAASGNDYSTLVYDDTVLPAAKG